MLTEVPSPDHKNYNSTQVLEEMRNIRQVIENRVKDPASYGARGAKNEIDIIKAPGQISDFDKYPEIATEQQNDINNAVRYANDPHNPEQSAFAQYVENAKRAATESITPPVAEFPDATAWRQQYHKSPGSNFYLLGTIGGNTFYGTLPKPKASIKPPVQHDALEGKSPLEKLRFYAAQARERASQKPVASHRALYQMLSQNRQPPQRSYAPVPGHNGVATGYGHVQRHAPASSNISPARAGAAARPQRPAQAATNDVSDAMYEIEISHMVSNYFFRQSRLPPRSAAGFDPLLSPAWGALKLPG